MLFASKKKAKSNCVSVGLYACVSYGNSKGW